MDWWGVEMCSLLILLLTAQLQRNNSKKCILLNLQSSYILALHCVHYSLADPFCQLLCILNVILILASNLLIFETKILTLSKIKIIRSLSSDDWKFEFANEELVELKSFWLIYYPNISLVFDGLKTLFFKVNNLELFKSLIKTMTFDLK